MTLARLALLEARRSGLPWLTLASIAVGTGMAGFLSRLALTESHETQAIVVAALFRLCAVFLVAILVVTSVVRDYADKGLELALSLPISRSVYYLGRLAGFAATGMLLAASFALAMLLWASPAATFVWFVSLTLESALVACASLFFVITLAQVVPALAATAAFYLIARAITALQAIASGPLTDSGGLAQRIAQWGLDAIAIALPPLDRATQTGWLVYGLPTPSEFAQLAGSLLVYGVLLTAAGLFDFHRRDL
jgi:ABC-type transport system involved in multi-copper enzyme maturation permease subunit